MNDLISFIILFCIIFITLSFMNIKEQELCKNEWLNCYFDRIILWDWNYKLDKYDLK